MKALVPIEGPRGTGWSRYYRRMRRELSRVSYLRSGYYLLLAIGEALRDNPKRGQAELDREFTPHEDPWNYATDPSHLERIRREMEMLDAVRGNRRFERVLEIGCAEGLFTEKLAPRCDSLLSADISTVALIRARHRLQAYLQVQFVHWDLRVDSIPGVFDLIVIVHALEYVRNPLHIRRARAKLVDSLRPGGYLLIGTMKTADVFENSWWGRFFLRSGKRINEFFAAHAALKVVQTANIPLGENIAFDMLLHKSE